MYMNPTIIKNNIPSIQTSLLKAKKMRSINSFIGMVLVSSFFSTDALAINPHTYVYVYLIFIHT